MAKTASEKANEILTMDYREIERVYHEFLESSEPESFQILLELLSYVVGYGR